MSFKIHRIAMVALLVGGAILLFSCKPKPEVKKEPLEAIKTEESRDLTIIMSENGRKSYLFNTPLLEGYTLGRDPYREFRKGIEITTFQDDSLTTVNAVLVANYAIFYEKRKLWEARGDVVITKHDGTRVYTQQLFWDSRAKLIYSNVDSKLVTETDILTGTGFESDEEMNEPRIRGLNAVMMVDKEQLRKEQQGETEEDQTPTNVNSSASKVVKVEPKILPVQNTKIKADKRSSQKMDRGTNNTFSRVPISHKQQPTGKTATAQRRSLEANSSSKKTK